MLKHRWFWVILLVGGLCRLTALTDGNLQKFGLDWDELNIVAISKLPLTQLFMIGLQRDLHPPGTWLLVWGWIKVCGDSDIAIRWFAWFTGMVGIAASYLMSWQLSKSNRVAILTGLLAVVSPWLWTYGHMVSYHSVYGASCLLAWYFLLRLQEGKRGVIGYLISTLISVFASANGILLLIYQGIYLTSIWRKELSFTFNKLLTLLGIIIVCWLPYALIIAQSDHFSHTTDLQNMIQPPWWTLLITPCNLLFLNTELRYFDSLPPPLILFALSLGTWLLLWVASRRGLQQWHLWLCITLLPILFTWTVHMLIFAPSGSKGIFHYRLLLPSIFGFHCLLATWISRHKQIFQILMMTTLISIQLWLPWKNHWRYELWPIWGKSMAKEIQAGDGIIVYPGNYYLSLSKYVTPNTFGLSVQERDFDPRRENIFHQINRQDDLFFALTGKDVLAHPETQKRLVAFIQQHHRVWLMITEDQDRFRPFLICPKTYIYPVNGGSFRMDTCPGQPKINQQE